jgi:hypothetical protein
MTPAKIYPFSIPAGGSFPLLVLGDYCKILTSSGPLSIQGDTFGTLGPILAGQGVEDSPFNRLVLVDNSGGVNNGTLLIADKKFIDDRISGDVSVIDGEKSRTLAGGMYSGNVYCVAVAGQYSNCQLWNPAGSGKNLIVTQLSYSTSVAAQIIFLMTPVQCANNFAIAIANKKAGAGSPVSVLKFESKVAAETFPIGILRNDSTPAGTSVQWPIKGVLVVPPGYGLNAYTSTVNVTNSINCEWFEEAIL